MNRNLCFIIAQQMISDISRPVINIQVHVWHSSHARLSHLGSNCIEEFFFKDVISHCFVFAFCLKYILCNLLNHNVKEKESMSDMLLLEWADLLHQSEYGKTRKESFTSRFCISLHRYNWVTVEFVFNTTPSLLIWPFLCLSIVLLIISRPTWAKAPASLPVP